jgi:outer membrane biosynthesis protein TonB
VSQQQKPQMVPGFNHNIKHKGKIFHVQTEDSGALNPHIITHLFVGGNILATKKTSYADIVNADNLHDIVRELMEEQHKAMLRNLVNGVYDNMDGQAVPATPDVQAPAALAPAQKQPEAPKPAPPKPVPAAQPDKFPPARPVPTPQTQPAMPAHEAPTVTSMPAQAPVELKPAKPAPVPQPTAKAAADAKELLPPEVEAARRMADRPIPKDTSGPTIFGEDLISEKSLDEVILGYLSGDGEDGN